MGEIVCVQNWGFNGGCNIILELVQVSVINFLDMYLCGISIEVLLLCLFLLWGCYDYDEKRICVYQLLLYVLNCVGIVLLWCDNQFGCKGVCEGLDFQLLFDVIILGLCVDGCCMDEILLQDLVIQVWVRFGDWVVVLYQLGNYGLVYFECYLFVFCCFILICDICDIGCCLCEEIINSYDNVVLYIDYFLIKIIGMLQGMQDYDMVMIYLFDYGELLGEKGLFLYGVLYVIVLVEQIWVLMMMWFLFGFVSSCGLDLQCVCKCLVVYIDYDNLFLLVLGLMQVRILLYECDCDVFVNCES